MQEENEKAPERSSRAGFRVVEISGIEPLFFVCLKVRKKSTVTHVTVRGLLLVEIRRLEVLFFV